MKRQSLGTVMHVLKNRSMDFTVHDLGEGWVTYYLEPCNILWVP